MIRHSADNDLLCMHLGGLSQDGTSTVVYGWWVLVLKQLLAASDRSTAYEEEEEELAMLFVFNCCVTCTAARSGLLQLNCIAVFGCYISRVYGHIGRVTLTAASATSTRRDA